MQDLGNGQYRVNCGTFWVITDTPPPKWRCIIGYWIMIIATFCPVVIALITIGVLEWII